MKKKSKTLTIIKNSKKIHKTLSLSEDLNFQRK